MLFDNPLTLNAVAVQSGDCHFFTLLACTCCFTPLAIQVGPPHVNHSVVTRSEKKVQETILALRGVVQGAPPELPMIIKPASCQGA
jgi:hypothetical protein